MKKRDLVRSMRNGSAPEYKDRAAAGEGRFLIELRKGRGAFEQHHQEELVVPFDLSAGPDYAGRAGLRTDNSKLREPVGTPIERDSFTDRIDVGLVHRPIHDLAIDIEASNRRQISRREPDRFEIAIAGGCDHRMKSCPELPIEKITMGRLCSVTISDGGNSANS